MDQLGLRKKVFLQQEDLEPALDLKQLHFYVEGQQVLQFQQQQKSIMEKLGQAVVHFLRQDNILQD